MQAKRCPSCERLFETSVGDFCAHDGTELVKVTTDDPNIGRLVDGRFRVQERLGSGGMGVVYAAEQASVGRRVAVKLIRADRAHKQDAFERFVRECRAVSKLSSPHTVWVVDAGVQEDGSAYLVMEYLKGETLRALLKRGGPLSVEVSTAYLRDIAASLSEAHALGIVHRDLKPSNVFVAELPDGNTVTKLLDFGIAVLDDPEDGQQLTSSSEIPGTPAYVAPERVTGEAFDARSDVYALGVVWYEMLTGETPFEGETAWDMLRAHVDQEPPLLSEVRPGLAMPPALEELLYRCLSKSPRGRPRDASELLRLLQADGGPTTGDLETLSSLMLRRPELEVAAAQATPAPSRQKVATTSTRRTSPWMAAALALVVSGAAFAVGRLSQPAAPTSSAEVPAARADVDTRRDPAAKTVKAQGDAGVTASSTDATASVPPVADALAQKADVTAALTPEAGPIPDAVAEAPPLAKKGRKKKPVANPKTKVAKKKPKPVVKRDPDNERIDRILDFEASKKGQK